MPTNENDSILRSLTRRRMLRGAGGLFAAAALPATERAASALSTGQGAPSRAAVEITGRLARYMVESRDRNLPAEACTQAKHRILDTLAAIVSARISHPARWRSVRAGAGRRRRGVCVHD